MNIGSRLVFWTQSAALLFDFLGLILYPQLHLIPHLVRCIFWDSAALLFDFFGTHFISATAFDTLTVALDFFC